jgi:hypothetical protein
MNAVDERAASIRMFTVPGWHVGTAVVRQYGGVAAEWERLRLLEHKNSGLADDDERFLALSAILQRLSIDLGLQTCTVNGAGTDGVAGITDRRGFLPNDPAYLWSGTWHEATEIWCRE